MSISRSKSLLFSLALAAFGTVGSIAHAQSLEQFPQAGTSSVSEILEGKQDSQVVTVQGTLTQAFDDGVYGFTDGTGEIQVVFSDELQAASTIMPGTPVEVTGEVSTNQQGMSELHATELEPVP